MSGCLPGPHPIEPRPGNVYVSVCACVCTCICTRHGLNVHAPTQSSRVEALTPTVMAFGGGDLGR